MLAKIMGDKERRERHKDKIDKLGSNKKRRVKAVETSKPADDSSVAAVITGMNNSTRHNQSMTGSVIRTSHNSVSTDLAVTFDTFGNPL